VHIGGTRLIFVVAAVLLACSLARGQTAPAAPAATPSPAVPATSPDATAPADVPAQPPAASLVISGRAASTWATSERGGASIVQIQGPVTIEIEKTTLTAKAAVVWLEAARGATAHPGDEQVTVALIGDAKVKTPEMTRSGDRLVVTARINGSIRITAEDRQPRDLSNSDTFKAAKQLREESEAQAKLAAPAEGGGGGVSAQPGAETMHLQPRTLTTQPGPGVTTRPAATPVLYHAADISNLTASNGKMALALGGRDGVVITRTDPDGNYLEMQAQRAVIFTTLDKPGDVREMQNVHRIEEAITGAYLEGDVRVNLTPVNLAAAEQRLEANRVYYDFTRDPRGAHRCGAAHDGRAAQHPDRRPR
jgi:hypothetical protein